jgi:hypothetical protein
MFCGPSLYVSWWNVVLPEVMVGIIPYGNEAGSFVSVQQPYSQMCPSHVQI